MTTSELKSYIDKTLGNSLRCLLPSYWWKRLFGLIIDDVNSVKVAVNNKPSKSDLTSLEEKIDGKLTEKQTIKISSLTSLTVYAEPDYIYVIRPNTKGTLNIAGFLAPWDGPEVMKFTFMFTNVNGLSLPRNVKWVNGENPEEIDPDLHYELSVVITKIGGSQICKAVLASFS